MKIIIITLTALIMVGCSVFPSTTSVSATSKLEKIDNPTLKVEQNFKWN
jgi:PBP1b-binding outer membrane lipoprotein LpoB